MTSVVKVQDLDIVFCVDNTSSMSSYITTVQANMIQIIDDIHAQENVNLRFALVSYRDFPPQDTTYSSQVHTWTSDMNSIRTAVNSMAAMGGGDGPECVTEGLYQVSQLQFRQLAAKICIFIADAPPHGLGENGDGFPDGDPTGRDPIAIAHELAKKGVVVYSVGCEPAINHYQYAKYFMMAISSITEGKYIPLADTQLLTSVIVGSAREEVNLTSAMNEIEKDAAMLGIDWNVIAANPTELPYDFVLKVMHQLVAKGVMTTHLIIEKLRFDEAFERENQAMNEGSKLICKEIALKSAKQAIAGFVLDFKQKEQERIAAEQKKLGGSASASRAPAKRTRAAAAVAQPQQPIQRVFVARDYITFDQVKRALARRAKTSNAI